MKSVNVYILFLLFVISCSNLRGEVILTEDWPYEVVNIKIPREVWKKAFRPTPVLKSPVTIVVPIHVTQGDEENEEDEIGENIVQENDDLIVNNEQEEIGEPIVALPPPQIPVNNQTQPIQDEQDTPASDEVSGQATRFPCSCPEGQCGCCTGAILDRINMKACGNISFIPEDFVFDVRLSINNNTVVRRRVSASDPPPICFNPRRAPFVEVCAELSNIRIRNRNAYACLDINANIADFPLYSTSFRCFGLGASGLQTGLKPKPVSSGPAPVNLFGNNNEEDAGGFLENAAGTVLGGEGLFGGGDGPFGGGDADDGGPLDAIGDAVGDFFDGRKI